jgi:hypothetical protein
MPLIQKNFAGSGGAQLGDRFLVDRNATTAVAFIAPDWGCLGTETVLIDGGMSEGVTRDTSGPVAGALAYPVSIEVSSNAQGDFYVHDGAAFLGPYSVSPATSMAMLVRLPSETLRVKFVSKQASSHVLVQARTVPSVKAMAAI